jgi:hypothetical protein
MREKTEGRKEVETPTPSISISDRHSETPYREYLKNGECGRWGKLMNCKGKLDNTENNHELEVGPSEQFQ